MLCAAQLLHLTLPVPAVCTSQAHSGVHIPAYVNTVLFIIGPELFEPCVDVYALEVTNGNGRHRTAARQWELRPREDSALLDADEGTRMHVYDNIRALLPTQRRPATQEDKRTAKMVERAVDAGAQLVAGAPAAMATAFPGGLPCILNDLTAHLAEASSGVHREFGNIEDNHDAASASSLALILCYLMDLGVREAVRYLRPFFSLFVFPCAIHACSC